MTDERAADWVDLQQLPTSYKVWAIRQMVVALRGHKWAEESLTVIEAGALQTLKLEQGWRSSRLVREGRAPNTKEVDPQVDRYTTALVGHCENYARIMSKDEPIGAAAHLVIKTYFPNGSGAITRQPMIAELAEVEGLVEGLRTTHAAEATLLGLDPLLLKLEALLPEYAAALGQTTKREVSYTSLQDARAADHERLCVFVARMIVRRVDEPAETEVIDAAMSVLRAILNKHLELRRTNRKTVEIDVNTGEPLLDEA